MRLVSLCKSAGAQLGEGEGETKTTINLVEKFVPNSESKTLK